MPSPAAATIEAPPRQLPAERDVVLDPVPAPKITVGIDARVAWKMEEVARIEANQRLVRSRVIYRGVRKSYGGDK